MLSSVRSLSGYENELEINNSEEDFEEYNNLRFFSRFWRFWNCGRLYIQRSLHERMIIWCTPRLQELNEQDPIQRHDQELLSNWGRGKMADVLLTIFQNAFPQMFYSDSNSTEMCFIGHNLQYSSFASENGFVPRRKQAIIRTNAGLVY